MDYAQEIKNKIEFIKKSNILNKLVTDLNNKFIAVPEIDIKSRVKDISSAIKKMEIKGYDTSAKITDLAGTMVVTRDIKDIYKIADYLKNNYEIGKPDDYIKHPRNGYQSYHMNIITKEGINIEVQLKTHEMYRSQNFIHDRIYKNYFIPEQLKPAIMKPLFLLITHMSEGSYKLKLPELDREVKKIETYGYGLSSDNVKDFLKSCYKAINSEIQKDMDKADTDYMSKKVTLDTCEKDLKRLKDSKFWLDDYYKNIQKLKSYNTTYGSIIRFFSKDARSEFSKLHEDIKLDKKFLTELGVKSQEEYKSLSDKINIDDIKYLREEVNALYLRLQEAKSIVNSFTKERSIEHGFNKDLSMKEIDFDR